MTKTTLTIAFDRDIADWLDRQDNRSRTVNEIIKRFIQERKQNEPEWIEKRLTELEEEHRKLKERQEALLS